MYHYTSCGLSQVWLKNGYELRETKYGPGVSIHDIRGLHKAIAKAIIEKSPALSGEEFRFLRKELDLSQAALGDILGKTDQAVAIWEKQNKVPREADLIVRALLIEEMNGSIHFKELLDRLKEIDRERVQFELSLAESAYGWAACA